MRVDIDDTDIDDHQSVLYKGELFTGTVVEVDKEGRMIAETDYVGGVRNGIHRGYYLNGQLEEEERYSVGLPHGQQRTWHPNGQLKDEALIDKGLEVTWKAWTEDGTPVDPRTREPLRDSDATQQG